MRTVVQDADEIGESKFGALPERVQDALGELAGAAREGLLALSVGVGLGVLSELMAEEVDDVVGPKGRHDAACPSSARGCARATAAVRWRWRLTRTSLTAIH